MSSEGEEATDVDENAPNEVAARRRKGKVPHAIEDIPRVRDETGERVRESFEGFLEKWALLWIVKTRLLMIFR